MAKKSTLALPDGLMTSLMNADKRNGLPAGTMLSIMQQEVGGQTDKFLTDPSAYHYGLNAEGKRIAPQSGKVSTAFGPFGILESTGAKPGYGVTPLKDKSLEEQIRFASDYLAARSKSSGGLVTGLAGYGEGSKYAAQVVSRVPGAAPVAVPPIASAAAPITPVAEPIASAVVAPAPVVTAQASPWQATQEQMQTPPQSPVEMLAQYGLPVPANYPMLPIEQEQAPTTAPVQLAKAPSNTVANAMQQGWIDSFMVPTGRRA